VTLSIGESLMIGLGISRQKLTGEMAVLAIQTRTKIESCAQVAFLPKKSV
jgi:hypothetical protein